MKQGNSMLMQTPSQTIGPYFAQGLFREGNETGANVLVTERTDGEMIRIEGCVTDGQGQPVTDALIEIWQANAYGRYNHPLDERDLPLDPTFAGHGRAATDFQGRYWFETVKPGSVAGLNHTPQAPHINAIVFARGMPAHAFTRIYFEDEATNQEDPVLMRIEDEVRRNSLIARRQAVAGHVIYRFDIRLQGKNETVFFDA